MTGPAGRRPDPAERRAAWAELLRLPAAFTVPGDVLAGAAAAGLRPGARTAAVAGTSTCLYLAGMVLNDWADRSEDAVERPHRPLPSGRIRPGEALVAGAALTAAGLALASRAGRPAFTVAGALAGTVWAYDLGLKRTAAGPAAMAAARSLDLLLGATATAAPTRTAATSAVTAALPSAAVLGAHTLAVTTVSRREAEGGSTALPAAALAATGVLGMLVARPPSGPGGRPSRTPARPLRPVARVRHLNGIRETTAPAGARERTTASAQRALAAGYVATAGRPLVHAALNPSPPLTQRAVGGGIRAMVPLQAALAARAGAPGSALAIAALAPLARHFARKVSVT